VSLIDRRPIKTDLMKMAKTTVQLPRLGQLPSLDSYQGKHGKKKKRALSSRFKAEMQGSLHMTYETTNKLRQTLISA